MPDVAFWRPKERWRKANATAWHITWQAASNWKDINWQAAAKLLNSQGKPGSGRPWNNSFGLAWIGLRSPERHRSTCIRNRETPAGFKPNHQNHPSKNCLTLLSDALKEDEERPTQLPDITWQAASILLKWHHLTGSGEIAKKTKESQAVDGHGLTASASLGLNLGAPRGTVQHASETGKPQQDSSPTRQNHPSKNCLTLLSDALKKERWRKANVTAWHHLTGSVEIEILGLRGAPFNMHPASETGKPQQDSSPTRQNHPSKKCLTLLSDALKKDEERPTQLPDISPDRQHRIERTSTDRQRRNC